MTANQWSYKPGAAPGWVDLFYGDLRVGECMWFRRVRHETVAMQRIVDSLNRPAAACHPAAQPTWAATPVERHDDRRPGEWEFAPIDDPKRPALGLIWWKVPAGLEHRVQRIVDALNAGNGLAAVALAGDDPAPVQVDPLYDTHNARSAA